MATLSIRERGSVALSVSVDGPGGEQAVRVRADPCEAVSVVLQRAMDRRRLDPRLAGRWGVYLRAPPGGATVELPAASSLAECGVTASSPLLVRHRGALCFSLRTDQLHDQVSGGEGEKREGEGDTHCYSWSGESP